MMPMSETTARRILARYRSAKVIETLSPTKTDEGRWCNFRPGSEISASECEIGEAGVS